MSQLSIAFNRSIMKSFKCWMSTFYLQSVGGVRSWMQVAVDICSRMLALLTESGGQRAVISFCIPVAWRHITVIDYIFVMSGSFRNIPHRGYVAEWCEVHAVLDAIIETKKKRWERKLYTSIFYFLFILFCSHNLFVFCQMIVPTKGCVCSWSQ